MNREQVLTLIASLTGQSNVLTIPRIFIDLTGSVESGLFLSQCIYWSDRTKDPGRWFYKSMADWESEIGLKRTRLETAIRNTSEIIETKVRRDPKGSPTIHYRVNYEALVNKLEAWVDSKILEMAEESDNPTNGFVDSSKSSSNNLQIELQGINKSLTETTPEITTKTEGGDGKEAKSRRPLMTWDLLEVKPGKEKTAALMVFETTQSLYSAWAPPAVVDLGVAFTEAAKIDPPLDKSGRSRWRKCLLDLLQNQISPEAIRKTVEYMTGKGLTITGPWSVADLAQAGVADKEAPKGFTRFVPGQTQL